MLLLQSVSTFATNDAVRNNIETLLELKKPKNMKAKDHSPQTIGEHFAASYLNPNHAVVSVLTDLNTKWIFFWFAPGEEDSRTSLYKLLLDGEEAVADAKYLLDSIYDNSAGHTLPMTFLKRQPLQAVLDDLLRRKRARIELDGDNGHPPKLDSKPSSSSGGGGEQHPGHSADSNTISGKRSNQSDTFGGSASMSMANALSLFAPPADQRA